MWGPRYGRGNGWHGGQRWPGPWYAWGPWGPAPDPTYAWPAPAGYQPFPPTYELAYLESYAKYLEEELERVKARIEELRKQSER